MEPKFKHSYLVIDANSLRRIFNFKRCIFDALVVLGGGEISSLFSFSETVMDTEMKLTSIDKIG